MVGIDFHIGDGEGTGLNHFGAEHTIDNVR